MLMLFVGANGHGEDAGVRKVQRATCKCRVQGAMCFSESVLGQQQTSHSKNDRGGGNSKVANDGGSKPRSAPGREGCEVN
jgi:hypothetical protein